MRDRTLFVLSVLSLLTSPGVLRADRLEPAGNARQVRERARALTPLADTSSGITRDLGAIAVIEHDGSSYDMFEADGTTPNEAARARVARRFFETHGDNYDFLVVFTNFEFSTPGLLAFFNPVRNDTTGIGLPPVDRGSLYGSPGRLKGYVDMAAVARYRALPQSLEPGTSGFLRTLGVVSHEVGHQWLARPRYRNPSGQLSADLLGRAGSHWSYLLDSDASVLYGSDWVPSGNGTFTAARTWDGYSPLDLYLMGLLDPARVAPFTLLRNPAVDPAGAPEEGVTIAAVPEAVTVDQVIAAEGARAPSHLLSPKEFRLGFVVLTAPGTEPSAEDLEAVERVRAAFAGHFFAITRGVAVADTTLAEEPPPPPSAAPDIEKALAWLVAQQSLDGRWEDAPGTALRDTATAVEILVATGAGPTALARGRAWLGTAAAPNVDYLARRARALSPSLSPTERAAFATAILAGQASGGGFGLGPGYEADALDTALALRALASLSHPPGEHVQRAFAALLALRHSSGGWAAAVEGRDVSTLVTAQVVLAIQDWPTLPPAQALLGPALGALLGRRNPDGGFGESPSTAYATALALEALASGGPPEATEGAIAWLHRSQLADGSWSGSRYQTALVVGALRGRFGANLAVPQASLVLDPSVADEGDTVHVTAKVRNVGRAAAGPQRTRLYDGDPSLGRIVDETVVAALAPGEEASVAFDFPTADRAGNRTLYVVADALNEVREAREDDNAAARALEVHGLLPDLEITPIDIAVSPYPPEEGETVQVAVTVRNRGERPSLPVQLQIVRGNPRSGGRILGQATLPAVAAGGQVSVSIPWDTTGARGSHELHAVVDGNFALEETNEDNNQASVPVTVTGPLPPGPDLEVALVQPVPRRLSTIPQSISVAVSVRNLGRDAVSSTVALRGGPAGPALGEQALSLGARSATILSFPIEVTSPGNRVFWAVADPSGSVSESNEDNNRASGALVDGQDTLDLEVRPAEVTPSSTDLVVGQPLLVTAVIRNRGTAALTNVPVILAHVTPSGPAELVRQTVSLSPGAAFTASFSWTTTITGESVPLAVVADPFGLLAELSEDNNRADLSVRIRPSAQPNLTLSGADVAFAPDPPLEGSAATVSALVRNPGAVAAGAFAVRFFRGDPDAGGSLIGEAALPGLAAGATAAAQVAWSPVDARGAQGVFVLVDPDDQVAEYDEGDNRVFRPFSVLGLPDLVLAAADVALVPAYPRAGEPVTIRATIRNLGGQPSGTAVLRAYEGELGGPVIAEAPIPPLAIGEALTLELPWTPAAPPGERRLSLAADADDQVREADEGNNSDRRSVVVQDADLYLTELYFSPDGDGVKDETRLAYRATGSVSIVVSDSLGQRVRTLAEGAPAEGSVAWDGRNDRGRLMPDSSYFLSVIGQGSQTLGRAQVVLDTNRSPIHDAAGTRQIAVRNVTCRLPDMSGPAWMPSEDEWLFIVRFPQGDFQPGLLRVGSDGQHRYVGAPDAWYGDAGYLSGAAVSPDGREVLIGQSSGAIFSVDLASGERRVLAEGASWGTWSPDGRFVLVGGNRVQARDGSLVGDLPQFMLDWSPDSQFLTDGNTIVRRDGSDLRTIPFPVPMEQVSQATWREDGRIFVAGGDDPEGGGTRFFSLLLDPETESWEELRWLAGRGGAWSPDGTKVLEDNLVLRPDGSDLRLVPPGPSDSGLRASPRRTAAAYFGNRDSQPGRACHGLGTSDLFVVTSLQNLTADLQVSRLPGNNGLLLRGSVSDRHLERAQLEYALASEPETWHPIGAASEVPVLDDVLGVWVPSGPGTYLLRLRVSDRAGNELRRTRIISWDRRPVLANITQDEALISPTGDGIKEAVRFRYLVQEPTRLEVRVLGPLPRDPGAPPPPTVRRLSFDYPDLGPASFVWDGRDDAGQVVADGRYTVLLNDLPLRVDVDATPPDIAFAYSNLRTAPGASSQEGCPAVGPAADRSWHVVDAHLKSWGEFGDWFYGTEPVYEFERDAAGQIVYDDDGLPRILRRNGRVVDRLLPGDSYGRTGFQAEDHAGNRSAVPILPLPHQVFLLVAVEAGAGASICPPAIGILPPVDSGKTYPFRPVMSFELYQPVAGAPLVFQYRRSNQAEWSQTPVSVVNPGDEYKEIFTWRRWEVDLVARGLDPLQEYRGRFTVTGPITLNSEEFSFRFCDFVIDGGPSGASNVPGTDLDRYEAGVRIVLPEPVESIRLTVVGSGDVAGFTLSAPMTFNASTGLYEATVVAPRVEPERHCADPRPLRSLRFEVAATGASGQVYRSRPGGCGRSSWAIPECSCGVSVAQERESCSEASPDHVRLVATRTSLFPDAIFQLERGPEDDPILLFEGPARVPLEDNPLRLTLDTTAFPEGDVDVRGRILRPNAPPHLRVCARQEIKVWIDRSAPVADVLQPPEGGALCVTPDPGSGRETVRLLVHVQDFARAVEIVASEYRFETSEWRPFPRICFDRECRDDPSHLPTGRTSPFDADVTGFAEGEYTLRLTLCDGSGNTRTVLRRFSISREPPSLELAGVSRPVFSPNGDSRSDDTAVTARTFQALQLTVEVRQGNDTGPLVRRLVNAQTFAVGAHPFVWDGRDGSGAAVSDGRYVLVVSGADACGGIGRLNVPLEVDLTPPRATLTRPTPGQAVATSVDSRGFASDLHFLSYELAFGEGGAPTAWTSIATSTLSVGADDRDGLLGRWDPPATEGPYTLRLVASDRAENTAEARVAVNVAPRAYLERLGVTPSVFSPNADGRRETATLEYELLLTGRVSLQVRDAQDALVRTVEAGLEHGPGLQAFPWDGRTDAGNPAPDGEYGLWIRVEDPAGLGAPQEQAVAFVLDRTPPQVLVERPAAGAYLTRSQQVRGTVSDDRLALYVVEAAPEGGAPIELLRGSQSRIGADLAPLTVLSDGPHALAVRGEDEAENRAQAQVPFIMDSLPPVARLLTPTTGAVLHKTTTPVEIVGTATDANLQDWLLSFGAGPEPAHFVEIARGSASATATRLAGWSVSNLPDGVYTLRLIATDRAAQAAEARTTVTLDGTPPDALLTTPAEGAFVGSEGPVTGTASDANLASWTLEMAPGAAAAAFQWSELATGTSAVTAADLAALAPLPTNGLHTLKLTVRDHAGQTASALRTFTVDTVPPPSPAPLTGLVEGAAAGAADVLLTWTAAGAPDLAGYLLSRDGTRLTPAPVAGTTLTDAQRPDGRYAYAVVAVDRAGNESTPASTTVRVDLTPPIADIVAPAAGAVVSGPVEVRGTAFSPDDFKEYRLRVGAGASPTSWTLLNRSTLTVSGGVLGSWTALGDGPYVLALEAEDVSGNVARATVTVTVDGQPPSAPVLTSVAIAAADTLRSTWQASPETDVDGYLVYRNGRIANAPGVVIGSLRAFLLPGPSYDDPTLPDGTHCYRVAAMDRADNVSPPSNELCQTLDNRRPHAVILEPASGTRFEFPIRVLADTPDRDIVAVQFQHKPQAEADWLALGAPDTQEPFEATFDPAGLAPGQYDLRAVARDAGGEDPSPTSITVVFGDTTPPPVPQGLSARVEAADVRLTWPAVTASDLHGYHVYRGEERLTTTPIAALEYADPGRPVATYLYRVSAVDLDGNESARSEPQEAVVYAVELDAPFPVTPATAADLTGSGARESSTVEIRRDPTVLAEVPAAANGAFSAAGVPLLGGPNLLRAQGKDAAGNRSIPSSDVVMIANTPPPAVTALEGAAAGLSVDLSWTPVVDAELFGYAVRRGPTDLTASAPQQIAAGIAASSSSGPHVPARAFDGNPATAWIPQGSDAAPAWTVTFPETVLVEKVALSFGYAGGPLAVGRYRIELAWEGRFLPLARVSGNAETDVVHVFPSAFATEAVRVVLEPGFVGLAEVAIGKRGLLPSGAASFHDPVADGRYAYEVAAVDRYGAEGPAASVEVAVGDVTAPAPPAGLAATVEAGDVLLSWNANAEPDLDHYVVRRDGSPIASVPTPQFRDVGRPNGTYTYTVLAVDAAGNASDPSAPATAEVAVAAPAAPVLGASPAASGAVALQWSHGGASGFTVHRATASGGPYTPVGRTGDVRSFLDGTAAPGLPHFYLVHAEDAYGNLSPASNEASATPQRTTPPAAPVILFPTDAANPIELDATETDVAGQAEASSLVSIEVDGALAGITEAGPGFVETRAVWLSAGATALTASSDSRRVAYSLDASPRGVYWTDVTGPDAGYVFDPAGGDAEPRAFSPDGSRLAYQVRRCPSGPCAVDLYLAELPSGDTTPIETGPDAAGDAAFSPTGDRLAFVDASASGQCRLQVLDLASGETTLVTSAIGCRHPSWSPDATRLAFLAQTAAGGPHQVRVVELAGLAVATVEDTAWEAAAPAWTADGGAVAYTSAASSRLRLRQYELAGGARRDLTDGSVSSFDPRLDPQGGWLSFGTWEAGVQKVVARRLDRGAQQDVDSRADVPAPEALALHAWTGRQDLALSLPDRFSFLPAEGRFQVGGVRLHPGENAVVAFAIEGDAGLTSPGSLPVRITVPAGLHPDLAVSADDLSTYPAVPLVGQPTRLGARVRNAGQAPAAGVLARLSLRDAAGDVVWQQEARISEIAAGGSVSVSAPWTAAAAGSYGLRVEVDPNDDLAESREDNNVADRGVYVVVSGVAIEVRADRESYPARAPAVVTVRLANGGPAGPFTARLTVDGADGTEAAVLDSRSVSLSYGQTVEYTLPWNTGTVYAGDYAFRVRVSGGPAPAEGARPFRILPDLSATARIVADRASVPAGSPAPFAVHAENTGANAPLDQAVARLLILPAGSAAPIHTAEAAIPRLLPGGAWDAQMSWPQAAPAGDYQARLEVRRDGQALATALTSFRVTDSAPSLSGVLELVPSQLLAGDPFQARATVTNRGTAAVVGQVFAVEVTGGSSPTPIARETFTLDLAPGETRTATVAIAGGTPAPGLYPVFLRTQPSVSLDRATLHVHGPITPPTIDSPPVGATVATSHPVLRVNNATAAPAATLSYEFELFADPGLTQPLPGAKGLAETPLRTSWRVAVNLAEDQTYYWRAQAGDGFSFSPWTAIGSFTVDQRNEPPSSPVPDSPLPGARVPSREPLLVVTNAEDPERGPLTYEFRLANDAPMTSVVASAAGISQGLGFTSWRVPVTLAENAVYYWSARAHDGAHASPWSAPLSFMVDTADEAPSAPTPIRPVAEEVAQLQSALVVANSIDPEDQPLTYRFEIDREPGFDSPFLQVSPPVAQALPHTSWTPPQPFTDNTRYYWRAAAHDGHGASAWAGTQFFVNLANDPPGVPFPLDPPDQGIVTTPTPTLRVLNASDLDGDALAYEFAVTDAGGTPVAGAGGVLPGSTETAWTVPTSLAENTSFRWTVRASDGEAFGGWTSPQEFRVNAVPDPPTAPTLVAPAEGAVLEGPRPALVVSNAFSPEGLPLTYTFELFAVGAGDVLTLVDRVDGVPGGIGRTAWTPGVDLADGLYSWRARAADPNQPGPWMPSARFRVRLDAPPAPPTGLLAIPGDASVRLTWNPSPELDVVSYQVYRGATSGGPYAPVASPTAPLHDDTGLLNGVTVYYVVTARDVGSESAYSAEVAATPIPAVLPAEVRLTPATVRGECLVRINSTCPKWVFATAELPAGRDPAGIVVSTVRLGGEVPPDPAYHPLVDSDQDGILEMRLRFPFGQVRPLLAIGTNTLSLSGRAGDKDFRGEGTLAVSPLAVKLRMTPRTLNRSSQGQEVQARLDFTDPVRAADVETSSLRLNETVPIERVVSSNGLRLTVKFDRAAVIAILPIGDEVEVRVSGTAGGVPFVAVDFIRVIQ